MINKSRIIQFWGLCDLLFIAWWASQTIIGGNIPIYYEIKTALNTSSSFGNLMPLFATLMALSLYASFIYSGKLLLQLNPKAAIVVYIQTPFRFITASPSLFFIIWPISYFSHGNKQMLTIGLVALFVSEAAKLALIIPWQINAKKDLERALGTLLAK